MAKKVMLKESDGPQRQEQHQPAPGAQTGSGRVHPWQYSKGARPTPKTKEAQEQEPETQVISVKSVNTLQAEQVAKGVLEAMRAGETLLVEKTRRGRFKFSMSPVIKRTRPLARAEFDAIVLNPEYLEFRDMWRALPVEGRKEYATQLGIEWVEYEDPKTTDFRLSKQVYEHAGIKKYRPEYESHKVRHELWNKGRK